MSKKVKFLVPLSLVVLYVLGAIMWFPGTNLNVDGGVEINLTAILAHLLNIILLYGVGLLIMIVAGKIQKKIKSKNLDSGK